MKWLGLARALEGGCESGNVLWIVWRELMASLLRLSCCSVFEQSGQETPGTRLRTYTPDPDCRCTYLKQLYMADSHDIGVVKKNEDQSQCKDR